MLEHFAVKNYKCLADVGIPLTPIHVIIGQNDSGKTSLLEAMLALSRSTRDEIPQAFPNDWQGCELVFEQAERPVVELTARFGTPSSDRTSLTYHIEVEFQDGGDRFCHRVEEWFEDNVRVAISEKEFFWSGLASHIFTPNDAIGDELDVIANRIGQACLYNFDPRQMAIPASIDPERKFRMDSDGFGLATLLDDILGYDPQRFIDLRYDFCGFFPQFRSVRIETQEALIRHHDISGRHRTETGIGKGIVFETSQGRAIRAQQASDGAVLFLGLLALIHSPEAPKLLLIEEPEKGVYPKRLQEIIELIRRLQDAPSARAAPQIIMTTHSPYLLTSFKPEEVTLMVRKDGPGPVHARPLRDAPNIEERLGNGEFYLGELWYNLSEDELFADA